jgi:predicted ATP-grasp superfamily ATP-dependent carboligase
VDGFRERELYTFPSSRRELSRILKYVYLSKVPIDGFEKARKWIEKEKEKLEHIMENMDLLFAPVASIETTQQQMAAKIEFSSCRDSSNSSGSSHVGQAKQIEATGDAVARLTLHNMPKSGEQCARQSDSQKWVPGGDLAIVSNYFHPNRSTRFPARTTNKTLTSDPIRIPESNPKVRTIDSHHFEVCTWQGKHEPIALKLDSLFSDTCPSLQIRKNQYF